MNYGTPSLRPRRLPPSKTDGAKNVDEKAKGNQGMQGGNGVASYTHGGKKGSKGGKGKGQAVQPAAAMQPQGPFSEEECNTTFEEFVSRLSQSERPVLEQFAKKVVCSLSKKDLVFFVLRMKDGLDDRATSSKKRASPDTTAAQSRPEKSSKGNQATTSSVPVVDQAEKRITSTSEPAKEATASASGGSALNKYAKEFLPLAELQAENKKLKETMNAASKRTQEEDITFQQCLQAIEGTTFFEGDEETLKSEELCGVLNKISPLCRKVKDFLSIWLSLRVPVAKQNEVAAIFVQYEQEGVPSSGVLSSLIKNQRMKMAQLEIMLKNNPAFLEKIPHCLANIFPTPKAEFGWSRTGWSFVQWLDFACKIISIEPYFDRLMRFNEIMEALRENGLTWEDAKKEKVYEAVAEMLEVEQSDVSDAIFF